MTNILQAVLKRLSVISIALAMLGCEAEPKSYYPLIEGKRWIYQMGAGGMFGGSASAKVVVTNLGQRDLNGRKVTAQKIDAGGQSYFAFIGQDEKGVYEYAIQTPQATAPEIKSLPNYSFQHPLTAGTNWQGEQETSMLANKTKVPLRLTIESIDETVTVPAGTFTKCLKVVGRGSTRKSMGPFMGSAKIEVEYHSWYALGVGLVKAVMKESSNHLMVGAGEGNLQLESFE